MLCISVHSVEIPIMGVPHLHFVRWGSRKNLGTIWLAAVWWGWPVLWANLCLHWVLQLNISCHKYRNIFWGQLNVLLVCLTIQIKQGVLWDLRNLSCGFSAGASFNSRVTSAIPVFTTTTPEPKQTGRSTGFWVVMPIDWHNNSVRCIGGFKQFNYAGGWEVTSLCMVVSG